MKKTQIKLLKEMEELTRECAIVANSYEQHINVLTSLNQPELTTESAYAYAEPLFNYDRVLMDSTLAEYTVESGNEGVSRGVSVVAYIIEAVQKIIVLFKNMFKSMYSKYILFINGIDKKASTLLGKIDTLSDDNNRKEFSKDEISSIANHVAILAMYNDKIDKGAISGILSIKDAIVPIDGIITGYAGFLKATAADLVKQYQITSGKNDEAASNLILNGYYANLSKSLFSSAHNINSLLYKKKAILEEVDYSDGARYTLVGFNHNTLSCLNGYFDLKKPILIFRAVNIKIKTSEVTKLVTLDPLNKTELKQLLDSLIKYNFKGHIDAVNNSFNSLAKTNTEIVKELSLKTVYTPGKNEIIGVMSGVMRVLNSTNFNAINTSVFTHINQTAQLLNNLLKFTELNIKTYKNGNSIMDSVSDIKLLPASTN